MNPSIAILGCGPAGLLAAHACETRGLYYRIYSKKRKSELYGSQYLHEPIPGITSDEPQKVKYVTLGSPEDYRRKTHGKWWDGTVAPEEFEPDHKAWNIRQAYDRLWRMYCRKVVPYDVKEAAKMYATFPDEAVSYDLQQNGDLGIGDKTNRFDLIISTLPRTIWAREGDEFIFSEGWVLGDAPEQGLFVEDEVDLGLKTVFGKDVNGSTLPVHDLMGKTYLNDGVIVCDGTASFPWTRLSRVHGYTTVEWPHHIPQPHPRASMVTKPLRHDVTGSRQAGAPPSAGWLHVGRYGEWKKGVVVTDAFRQVNEALDNFERKAQK